MCRREIRNRAQATGAPAQASTTFSPIARINVLFPLIFDPLTIHSRVAPPIPAQLTDAAYPSPQTAALLPPTPETPPPPARTRTTPASTAPQTPRSPRSTSQSGRRNAAATPRSPSQTEESTTPARPPVQKTGFAPNPAARSIGPAAGSAARPSSPPSRARV